MTEYDDRMYEYAQQEQARRARALAFRDCVGQLACGGEPDEPMTRGRYAIQAAEGMVLEVMANRWRGDDFDAYSRVVLPPVELSGQDMRARRATASRQHCFTRAHHSVFDGEFDQAAKALPLEQEADDEESVAAGRDLRFAGIVGSLMPGYVPPEYVVAATFVDVEVRLPTGRNYATENIRDGDLADPITALDHETIRDRAKDTARARVPFFGADGYSQAEHQWLMGIMARVGEPLDPDDIDTSTWRYI